MLLLLFFISLVSHCLLLYVCLLRPVIVKCAFDILLIKATYLLTLSMLQEADIASSDVCLYVCLSIGANIENL